MRALSLSALVCLLWSGLAFAAPDFPALTGRVVDNAHVLSAGARQSLEQSLAEYENGTANQVVVVTLPSLGGDSIEDYGYRLGRHWQIGEKGKDNGALLIVAPKERKVRIEVGYGLEPVLTDAASSSIVNGVILPAFRAGHMEQGIVEGTQAMLAVLGGKPAPLAPRGQQEQQQITPAQTILAILFLIGFLWLSIKHPLLAWWLFSNTTRIGGSRMESSGWSSGGFSGGGGSFGGGGASGGW